MEKPKFKIGDEVVCLCGGKACKKFYTIQELRPLQGEMKAENEKGDLAFFDIEVNGLVLQEVFNSPLFEALR